MLWPLQVLNLPRRTELEEKTALQVNFTTHVHTKAITCDWRSQKEVTLGTTVLEFQQNEPHKSSSIIVGILCFSFLMLMETNNYCKHSLYSYPAMVLYPIHTYTCMFFTGVESNKVYNCAEAPFDVPIFVPYSGFLFCAAVLLLHFLRNNCSTNFYSTKCL